MFKKVAILILIIFINKIALSQNIKTTDTVFKSSMRINQSIYKIPYSVNIIDYKQIKKYGYRTTPESLSDIPGLFVQKTNHGGGSVFIRGLTGNQTLLLIDGIRLNNSTYRYGPNQYLNTVDVFDVNKIEVLKGGGSVQYGSDAMCGVINVQSPDHEFSSKKTWKNIVITKFVSGNMEKTFHENLLYLTDKSSSSIAVTTRDFGDLIGGDTTGKQIQSGYKETCLNYSSKFKLNKQSQLIIASKNVSQRNIPFYYKLALENYKINQIDLQFHSLNYIKHELYKTNKYFKKITSIVSYQKSIENKSTQKNGSDLKYYEKNSVNTLGITSDIESNINSKVKINSGIEFYHDLIFSGKEELNTVTKNSVFSRGLYPNYSLYSSFSLFSLQEFKTNNFIFQTGIRYNTFASSISDTSIGRVLLHTNAVVYNMSLLFNINNENSLFGSICSGYRAPNIDDLGSLGIVDFRYELPTANLKPEKSINLELGHKLNYQKLNTEFCVYYTRLRDIITRVKDSNMIINGYSVYSKKNIQKGFIYGLEFSVHYSILNNLFLASNVSYAFGQNISQNEPIRRIPPLNGMFAINWKLKIIDINYKWIAADSQNRLAEGDKNDNRIPKLGTPSWNVHNFSLGKEYKSFSINGGIYNIFNKDYKTHGSGINGIGRSTWLTLTYKY